MNILEEQRVSYAFQPIVDAKTGAVLGFEALMRPNSDILKHHPMSCKSPKHKNNCTVWSI